MFAGKVGLGIQRTPGYGSNRFKLYSPQVLLLSLYLVTDTC